jgi:hypothetical protein
MASLLLVPRDGVRDAHLAVLIVDRRIPRSLQRNAAAMNAPADVPKACGFRVEPVAARPRGDARSGRPGWD